MTSKDFVDAYPRHITKFFSASDEDAEYTVFLEWVANRNIESLVLVVDPYYWNRLAPSIISHKTFQHVSLFPNAFAFMDDTPWVPGCTHFTNGFFSIRFNPDNAQEQPTALMTWMAQLERSVPQYTLYFRNLGKAVVELPHFHSQTGVIKNIMCSSVFGKGFVGLTQLPPTIPGWLDLRNIVLTHAELEYLGSTFSNLKLRHCQFENCRPVHFTCKALEVCPTALQYIDSLQGTQSLTLWLQRDMDHLLVRMVECHKTIEVPEVIIAGATDDVQQLFTLLRALFPQSQITNLIGIMF